MMEKVSFCSDRGGWHCSTFIISSLRRLRCEDPEFRIILDYTVFYFISEIEDNLRKIKQD